jgi:murein DD-endopeptidase MepM/ murein hydrolase activator NlpD
MKDKSLFSILIGLLLVFPCLSVGAQENQPVEPVYIVQPGDTLWAIARIFNVTLEDLIDANGISDPSIINVGNQLVIPGLEGLNGVLTLGTVPFGESFWSLSRRYQIPFEIMARLNRYTSPDEVAAGSNLVTLDRGEGSLSPVGGRATLRVGQSLLELAIKENTTPWALVAENGLEAIWGVLPGDVLFVPGVDDHGPGAMPEVITSLDITPSPVSQGKTMVYRIQASQDLTLTGSFYDHQLNFFQDDQGYVALQGVHAMLEPGYYPSVIKGFLEDGTSFEYSQNIYVQDGGYPFDSPLVVDSETVDVENTSPEDFEWFSIVEPVTPERLWEGTFEVPVPDYLKDCYTSFFGNRRSYNGSAYQYFHTGLDYCGINVEIYAPAPGVVVFTGPLIVRGNATVIDHGWGVYTAYAHQSEILVTVGDRVEKGQVIGITGDTGRVSGPHLHWEVIVGGVQVDPLDWLARSFP